jgi:recombination protein RecT
MNNIARQTNALPEVRMQLDAMAAQFAAVLPKHISPAKFVRVVLTAIQNVPELLDVERRSLFNACMRAATDGLLPDGRLGAIVIFKDKSRGKIAQWMPMIAGLRQKVRNSGEIIDWNAHVVHERDHWDYSEGDNPHIIHKPVRGDRGPVIAAYSVARLKSGEVSREWMWIEELDKVRRVSRSGEGGPWATWTDEMYRKTVARRHAKVLPMSTDLEGVFEREDKDGPPDSTIKPDEDNGRITTMVEALDRISGKTPEKKTADDGVDTDTGEVIDQGEYADSDDEQLPLEDRHAAKTG